MPVSAFSGKPKRRGACSIKTSSPSLMPGRSMISPISPWSFSRGGISQSTARPDNLLPVPVVARIVARVAEALAYAHRQMVVHRDIKPANIMYERESDTVKVTDFGIARITDSSKTKTGLVLGTPSFMSPEQLAGKKVDGRSDLYSLGVMLFQMLTGVLPFRGDSMAELMFKIANEEAPDIRVVRPDLSAELARIVAMMLIKRPELRYQDGDKLAADLKRRHPGSMQWKCVRALSLTTLYRVGVTFWTTRPATPSEFQQTVAQKASPRPAGTDAADIEI